MTKEQAIQYLPFIQALAEGKTIQYYVEPEGKWVDRENPKFSEPQDRYRIKPEIEPEPITMRVWVAPSIQGHLITEHDMSKYYPDWRKATAVVTFD